MLDDVPIRVWLIIAIAAAAFAPGQYVYNHLTHSPQGRDITLPPEDLSWRTSGQLIRSLALLGALATLAVFIFTPAAEKFASSPSFVPILLLGFSAFALLSVVNGVARGRIEPLIRGHSNEYERKTQPIKFWASLSWNAGLSCLLAWASFGMQAQAAEDRCENHGDVYTPEEQLSACNELINGGDLTGAERADALAGRGLAHHLLGDYRSALLDYSEAIRIDPRDSYTLYNRGLVHSHFGDWQPALADYNLSLELRPDNAEGYLNRGLLYLDTGRFHEAIADFTEAHAREPHDAWALANRGISHAWMNETEQAERDFESARKIDPSNPGVLRGEAVLSMHAGDMDAMVERLTEALRIDPEDAWSLRMRAEAYWRLGEKDKARDDDDTLWQLRSQAEASLVGEG